MVSLKKIYSVRWRQDEPQNSFGAGRSTLFNHFPFCCPGPQEKFLKKFLMNDRENEKLFGTLELQENWQKKFLSHFFSS